MKFTPMMCFQYACSELPPKLRNLQICLYYRARLLTFSDHPTFSLIWTVGAISTQTTLIIRHLISKPILSLQIFVGQMVSPKKFFVNHLANPLLPPWIVKSDAIDLHFLSILINNDNTNINQQLLFE